MSIVYKLSNLSKSYKDKIVFKNLSFEISSGEMVAIIGESGSGKSTLLNILGLLDDCEEGNIFIQGKDITKISKSEKVNLYRNEISFLFQNYALIEDGTVNENLDIALVYSKLNKEDKIKLKENVIKDVGLNCNLNTKVYTLSGGEQQRVALARIMLKSSNIILADEPTGSLDNLNRDYVLLLLKNLKQAGKAVIIVTHDNFVANTCDKIINISDFKPII